MRQYVYHAMSIIIFTTIPDQHFWGAIYGGVFNMKLLLVFLLSLLVFLMLLLVFQQVLLVFLMLLLVFLMLLLVFQQPFTRFF